MMRRVWGKVKLAFMKFPMMLQASSSTQAHRRHLKAYVQIGLSERGKVETWRFFHQRNVVQERLTLKLYFIQLKVMA